MAKDILDPNPFANPTLAKSGNDAARDIYTSVGFALDRWEHCEVGFSGLYSAFLEAPEGNHILLRSYGTVVSSSVRFEMIKAACDAFFAIYDNSELKAQTRHYLNLYKSASARRNEIAHAMVSGQMNYKVVNKKAIPLPTIWYLVPPFIATRKTQPIPDPNEFPYGPKFRYSSSEIDQFSKCFEELHMRVSKHSQAVRAFRKSFSNK